MITEAEFLAWLGRHTQDERLAARLVESLRRESRFADSDSGDVVQLSIKPTKES